MFGFSKTKIENYINGSSTEYPSVLWQIKVWRFAFMVTFHRHCYSYKRPQRYVLQTSFAFDRRFDERKKKSSG